MKQKLITGAAVFAAIASYAQDRPNIVFIYADDLDADEIGCTSDEYETWPSYTGQRRLAQGNIKGRNNGYKDPRMHTPNIDRMAEEGAVLQRFYITSPVSTASRYSLLTGKYASRSTGVLQEFGADSTAMIGFNTSVERADYNIAKCMKSAGYSTGFLGKWHNYPNDYRYKQPVLPHNPQKKDYEEKGKRVAIAYENAVSFLRDGYGWDYVDRINIGNSVFNLEWVVEGAFDFMEQNRENPFFLYVALPVPHGQYSYEYCDVSKLEPLATSAGLLEKLPDVMPSRASIYERLDSLGIARENAMATYKDDAVGAILSKLDELGIGDNTIVFFVGDNPSRGKWSVYEGAREPAFVRWPARIKPGTRIDALCANIDILPTMLEAAGGKIPKSERIDGQSFLKILEDGNTPAKWRKTLLLETGYSKAVVSDEWKYIANRPPEKIARIIADDCAANSSKPGKGNYFWNGTNHHGYRVNVDFPAYYDADQLYNLKEDLYETTNVVGRKENSSILKNLKKSMKDYVSDFPFSFGEFTSKITVDEK
ncbi:MAG: sulfatase [Candidatus Cryptobacteroides sp.]